MIDFMTAYRNRCERVQSELEKLAEDLKEKGFIVYGNRNGFLTFLKIYKDGKSLVYGFTSTPYRWYISVELDINQGKGSSRTVLEDYRTHSLEAGEIVDHLGHSFSFSEDLEKLDKKNWYLKRF